MVQEVRGETVAQGVWGSVPTDARTLHMLGHDAFEGARGEPRSVTPQEDGVWVGAHWPWTKDVRRVLNVPELIAFPLLQRPTTVALI